tara:strand:+ start:3581 stop:3814 length:234 start_codon:yes stop_codon:yes gene_type:complete
MTTSRLVKNAEGNYEWINIDPVSKPIGIKNAQKEDLTVDGYINKYGGIKSNIDSKVYTSKRSYMEHVKANNCVIKDW